MEHKKSSKKKRCKKTKKKPIDEAAIALAAENAKVALIDSLVAKTEMTKEEVLGAYDDFYQKFPGGVINKKEFLKQSTVS